LGLGELAVFFRVSLPLAWRGIVAGILLAFARAMGEFGATLMIAGSIVGKTQTLALAVYEAVQAGQEQMALFLVLLTSLTSIALLCAASFVVSRQAQERVK
jgi:molybdate transport system permease protein